MKLSDVMGAMAMSGYAVVGLVIAGAAFVAVVVATLLRRNRAPFERARLMPLTGDDDAPMSACAKRPGRPTEGGRGQ